jgi:alkylation response protein AidB-like acyl-CoA dehydrogenase
LTVQSIYDTDETQQLRASARGFLAHYWPPEQALSLAAQPDALRDLWKRAASQGWTSLGSDAEEGGMREVVVLLEELGRAACPLPLLDAFLATVALSQNAGPGVREALQQLAAGTAAISLALGAYDGDDRAGRSDVLPGSGKDPRLIGALRFAEGLSIATHLLVVVASDTAVALIRTDAPGVSVTPTPGFAVPSLSDIHLENVPGQLITLSQDMLRELVSLARLGCVARALGAANRVFELAVEHARVRQQFGHPIGHFQALQHKLANCLINIEASRLLLNRTATAYDNHDPHWGAAATAACAFANPALRQTILESQHALGGISYMEEHEAPRHFRRVHADLLRFGGVHAARGELAGLLLEDYG